MRKQRRACTGFRKKEGSTIRIDHVAIEDEPSGVTLIYTITVDEKSLNLWYRFPPNSIDSISHEVADGVLVTLLPYALRGGYNIESALPVSERLWFQLTSQLIPQFCVSSAEYWHVEINAPLISPAYYPDRVATAMSCGVDSFTTFFQYTKDMLDESRKVNLLTFFENGAHHNGIVGHSERESIIFQEQLEHVRAFCDAIHFPLLSVSSNLDAFLSDLFWQDSFEYTHAFRNVGFVLLLQKQIHIYYYAGASDISHFSVSLWDDSEHYEKWLLPNLSTDCTQVFSVSTEMNRTEKTLYISQFPETYDHLLVCFTSGTNCGKCLKCVRQLLTLDYLGLLQTYKNSIPYEMYHKGKPWYEQQLLGLRRKDMFLDEVYRCALDHGVHFPVGLRVKAFLSRKRFQARILKNIMIRKLSRLFRR